MEMSSEMSSTPDWLTLRKQNHIYTTLLNNGDCYHHHPRQHRAPGGAFPAGGDIGDLGGVGQACRRPLEEGLPGCCGEASDGRAREGAQAAQGGTVEEEAAAAAHPEDAGGVPAQGGASGAGACQSEAQVRRSRAAGGGEAGGHPAEGGAGHGELREEGEARADAVRQPERQHSG
jgi:hypothetical protein